MESVSAGRRVGFALSRCLDRKIESGRCATVCMGRAGELETRPGSARRSHQHKIIEDARLSNAKCRTGRLGEPGPFRSAESPDSIH